MFHTPQQNAMQARVSRHDAAWPTMAHLRLQFYADDDSAWHCSGNIREARRPPLPTFLLTSSYDAFALAFITFFFRTVAAHSLHTA